MVVVDRSYRTMLGLPFYDRVLEVDMLGELLSSVRTVVVYGPRNAGKSELVRYFLSKRLRDVLGHGFTVVAVDARRRVAERYTGSSTAADVVRGPVEVLLSRAGLPRGLVAVF